MAERPENPKAFPETFAIEANPTAGPDGVAYHEVCVSGGMSLRDYFAGQVVTGYVGTAMLPNPSQEEAWVTHAARMAYALADAMLAARGK